VLLYGLPFVLNADGLPRAAGGLQTTASFSHHTVVHPGLSWASSVLAETVHLPTAQAYSTRMLQVETGPHFTWDQGRFDLHLPAQASRIWRGGSGHQHTTGWSPQWRWRLDEGHSLTVGLGGSRQGLDDAPAMDLTRREARVGWRLQPWAGWSLEPQWRWASERANDEAFSNRQHGWALSLGGTLSPHWRLQADVGRMRVTHRAAESWADAPRNDTRDTASLALTRHLSGAWYATLGWQRWLTRSNLGLYQQQRTQVRATLSHSF
jgi:hypothetical protein